MSRRDWTKEETIVAFNVYCKIPFKNSSKTNPIIIKYANIIGRSPSALNMKIGNFGRLDPELRKRGIVGLSNGSKLEEKTWNEFHGNWEELAYQSELLIAKFQNKTIEETLPENLKNIPEGIERNRLVKLRVNQNFFRSAILSSYNSKCCITSLSIPELLVASHIVPWSKDKSNRLNPRNGLCLNSIHDKAFDKGYISVSSDYRIIISNELKKYSGESIKQFFLRYENEPILLPNKFYPNVEFLKYHKENIFIGE